MHGAINIKKKRLCSSWRKRQG